MQLPALDLGSLQVVGIASTLCHKKSHSVSQDFYFSNNTLSNLAPIAPQFVATGPTTLVLKEKKGLILTGMIYCFASL
jgi:hypothetical protein